MFKFLNNLSIQAKLITRLSLILLIGAVSGVLVMTSVMRVGSGLSVMEQVSMVKGKFEDLQNHTNDVHVSMVDFVSFGNLERRDDFETGAAKVPAMVNDLSGVIENDKIKAELLNIESLFNTWINDITVKQLNYMRSPTTVDMATDKADIINKNISSVTVRDTKSRWGSCSHKGELSFSWRLIFAPYDAIDYVIAHEVAHLIHMDHSKNFWTLCRSLSSNFVEGKFWMQNHGNSLMRYGINDQ